MIKVLVTGAGGVIGSAVLKQLHGKYDLVALDREAVADVKSVCVDVSDFEAVKNACVGVDVVVHLAGEIHSDWAGYLASNVVGTYNVFEAAHQTGVKRVIFASSGSVTAGWEREKPITDLVDGNYEAVPDVWENVTHETLPRPAGLYGCTKLWGEGLARHYSDSTDLSVICLRIGGVNAQDRPLTTRHYAVWCSQGNIARMVEACVCAPDALKFDVFYVVSNNKWAYRDMTHAKEMLGFEPEGSAEDFRCD
jgi:nucleoside-diphosphate-sugar epimerase